MGSLAVLMDLDGADRLGGSSVRCKLRPYFYYLPPLRRAIVLEHVQLHRFADQFLQLGAEPVQLRTAMAGRHARPGSLDTNPDVVQVPADRYRGYPGRPWYPPVYRVSDLVDAQVLDRHDLRPGRDPGLPGPGHLDVVGQQPVRHVPLALLISRGIGPGHLVGQLQVHVGIEVYPQRHGRLARVTPGDDHPAGGGVILPGLGHPGPDLLLERAVVSHAMSFAAMQPRALIAWLGSDRYCRQREPAALVLTAATGAGRRQLGVRQALLPTPKLPSIPGTSNRTSRTAHEPFPAADVVLGLAAPP